MQTITELTLNDSMFYRNIPVFTYHITYPSFSTTCVLAAAQAANTYYMQLAKTTEQYCRTVLYPQAVESARYIPANYPPFNRYTLDIIPAALPVFIWIPTPTWAAPTRS